VELTGSQQIRRDRAGVWSALNEPVVLQQCIPGCESLTRDGNNSYRIVLVAAVGPVKARFSGKLVLSDIRPQEGYALSFEGSGGAAGFGKGGATVTLASAEGGTLLTYRAEAKVGGKLAQVGSRLIDGVAAKMAADFFTRFKSTVEVPELQASAASGTAAALDPAAAETGAGGAFPTRLLVASGTVLLAAIAWYFLRGV
jgi:carbon monoxide dehydrogenase subunit G